MDALILLINNGHNPFTGQGGLGYKPKIEMYGYGGLGYKLPIHGGSGKAPSTTLIKKAPMTVANIDEDEDEEDEEDDDEEEEEELVEYEEPEEDKITTEALEEDVQKLTTLLEKRENDLMALIRRRKPINEITTFKTSNEKLNDELKIKKEALEKLKSEDKIIHSVKKTYSFKAYDNETLTKLNAIKFDGSEIDFIDEDLEGVLEKFNNKQLVVYEKPQFTYQQSTMKTTILKQIPISIGNLLLKDIPATSYNSSGTPFEVRTTIPQSCIITKKNKKTGLITSQSISFPEIEIPENKKEKEKMNISIQESKVFLKECQGVCDSILGKEGAIIEWNNNLLKTFGFEGINSFCIDTCCRVGNEKMFIECKKYDASYSLTELVEQYTDMFNGYYLQYKDDLDKKIEIIKKIKNVLKLYKKTKNKSVLEMLKEYGSTIEEIKEKLKEEEEEFENMLDDVQTNNKFDMFKMEMLFWKHTPYPSIPMGLNKFFSAQDDIDLVNSPNNNQEVNVLIKNRKTAYDIVPNKTNGVNLGKIKNIIQNTKTNSIEQNAILQTVYQFDKGSQYDLAFNIAFDDGVGFYNHSDFLRKIGKYIDVYNLFRGVYSMYDGNTGKKSDYDSVAIPISLLTSINLKNGIEGLIEKDYSTKPPKPLKVAKVKVAKTVAKKK
jgi:hypothetical protein